MPFVIPYHLVEWQLEQMSRYLDTLQYSLQNSRDEYFQKLKEYDLTDEELIDEFYDEIAKIRDGYPQMFYSSFILTWYTFIERELLRICYQIDREIRENKQKYRDGSINTSRKFLVEQRNYKIDKDHWTEIKSIQKTRNHIAHGNTEFRWRYEQPKGQNIKVHVSDDEIGEVYLLVDPNFYQLLIQNKLIKFSGPYFVLSPSYDFCKYLIDFGEEFLEKIYGELGWIA
jgi:hypothetical protein